MDNFKEETEVYRQTGVEDTEGVSQGPTVCGRQLNGRGVAAYHPETGPDPVGPAIKFEFYYLRMGSP